MYRIEHGVKSLLIDDDNCDCQSSLSMGHGMCGDGYDSRFGKENSFGVDALYDPGCNSTRPDYSLSLYFRG